MSSPGHHRIQTVSTWYMSIADHRGFRSISVFPLSLSRNRNNVAEIPGSTAAHSSCFVLGAVAIWRAPTLFSRMEAEFVAG
jgi:hypothetical protein